MRARNGDPDIEGHGPEKLREETRRIRRVQRTIDLVQQLLAHSELSRGEALRLMAGARRFTLALFPDKGAVYDLIYTPRLMRTYSSRFDGPLPLQRSEEP
jgi:hypothetical protein